MLSPVRAETPLWTHKCHKDHTPVRDEVEKGLDLTMLLKHPPNIITVGFVLYTLRNCRSASSQKEKYTLRGNPKPWTGSNSPNRHSFKVRIYLDVSDEQRSTRAFTTNSFFNERVVEFIVLADTFWLRLATECSLRVVGSLI